MLFAGNLFAGWRTVSALTRYGARVRTRPPPPRSCSWSVSGRRMLAGPSSFRQRILD
jgi:hypothetical protein